MSMKTIMRGLVVACCAALGLHAWADTISNLDTTFEVVDGASNVAINSLTIPSKEGLPVGSIVTIQSIGVTYRNTTYPEKLTLNGVDSTSRSEAEAITLNPGNKAANLVRFNFNDVEVTVGTTTPITNAGSLSIYLPKNPNGTVLGKSNYPAYGLAYEIIYTVKEIADEPVTYTCTVDGSSTSWDPTLATLKATDSLVYTGSGTVDLPAGATIVSSITIGDGVTLNVTESGLVKSKVTNNGTIKVTGGTESSPIVITEDQGANTTIGTIQIVANSCLKIDATGSGNKKYTVTGDSATTSTLILASNHDWGLTDGSEVRNAKVIVTHKCWWERTNAFDESVDLEMQGVEMVTVGNNYTVGSINGTGSFSRSGNSTITITQPRGDTTFAGSCAVPLTVGGSNALTLTGTLTGGLTISEDATVKIAPASGTCNLPTIAEASAGKLVVASGTVNVQGQRVALDVLDGAVVKIVATTAEIAAGKITLPVPAEHAEVSDSKVAVVDANGDEVVMTGIAEGAEQNTIVISLQTNAPITESCNLSEKIEGKSGMIVVQGSTGESAAIAINVDCAIPEGLQLSVTGKADFSFGESSSVSAGTIKLENGAVTTVSGAINNTITLSDGATLITSGAVTFGEGKQIARSANNKNATLTIPADSTVTLENGNSVSPHMTFNVYGTFDLNGAGFAAKSYNAEAEFNFYAGSTIRNGTLNHNGGYHLVFNCKDVSSLPAEEKVVTVSANVFMENWPGVSNIFKYDSGVSVSFTGNATGSGSMIMQAANGVGLRVMKNTYTSSTGRALKGDIVVDAGATLNVTVGDGFEYETNKANLDVYGTINVNDKRQTLSSSTQSWGAGTIKLHNGAQIIGAGASHASTTVGLDIWNATTITVDGTVTISTPIYGEAARSSVSFVKAEGAETAVVNMTGLNTLNGGFKVGEGVVVDCGTDKATKYAVTLQGGTLKWAGAGNAHGSLVKSVTLTANSCIESTKVGGFVGIGVGGSEETTIDLAGHTLTMKAAQASDRVYFDKTSITSAGTLEIEQGILFVHCKHLATVEDVDLVIGENAMVQNAGDANFDGDRSMTVRNLTNNGSAPSAEFLKLIVTGTLSGSGTIGQLELANGATIDVAEIPEGGVVVSATNSLTINDISTIKLAIGGEETTEYTLAIGEDGKSVVAKSAGPTSWDTITDEDLPESFAGADLDAVKTWAASFAGTFSTEALAGLDVDAFLLGCAPANVETEKAKFKIISVENVGGEWIVKVAGNVGEGEKYGNGYVVIESVKAELFPKAGDDADFFQATLQVTAPVAE